MAVYYVLGILLVVWALGLSALGLARPDFPPSGQGGRLLIGVTALIVAGALVALLATTHKEHPREEATAKAAELKKEQQQEKSGGPSTAPGTPTPPAQGGKTVKATEKEFSITLASGNSLTAGRYTFAIQNVGKIQHDLAVQGNGKQVKTPLLDPGASKDLPASLKAGKYKFYCTVPGHEQAGMKVDVTVK
jgi:plastocyanin